MINDGGNAVEIYGPIQRQLSVGACRMEVFLDGRLCPELEVLRLVKGGRSGYGRADIVVEGLSDLSEAGSKYGCGKGVRIVRAAAGAESLPIFSGRIERCREQLSGRGCRVELLVRDYSSVFERTTVYGRYVQAGLHEAWVAGVDTVFNENGRANAGAALAGEGLVFSGDSADQRYWSCADVIYYLLSRYVGAGELEIPYWGYLHGLAGDVEVNDLDVTGLNLLEAVERCCRAGQLRFRFEPVMGAAGPGGQAIVFYRPGRGRQVELNIQRASERLRISDTNVCEYRLDRGMPVTNRYIGRGDYKVFESTFELAGAWDKTLEQPLYRLYSPATNTDFHKFRDVWRKWCLNEAGDYSDEPYLAGAIYDFSPVFGGDSYIRRRRRFWPTISTDGRGESVGYYLERSLDGGESWSQYVHAFDNLHGQCGIWLSSESLDIETWVAAIKGMLRFRITASVVSDQWLSYSVCDGPVGSCVEVVDRLVDVPGLFRYRHICKGSVLRSAGGKGGVDDSSRLREFVWQQVGERGSRFRMRVNTILAETSYEVGDVVVCGPESRDLFGGTFGGGIVNTIERVEVDYAGQSSCIDIVQRREY